ncbi:hypothetical protein ACP70R_037372 [Stipagrostis hirtigluma subsp. patula]
MLDEMCDTLLVEEILPRLPPKHLFRLRAVSRRFNALAVSRRFNALAVSPEFAARYWHRPRAGVFFQPLEQPDEFPPRFLSDPATGHDDGAAIELVSGAELAFLPGPSAREEAYLRRVDVVNTGSVVAVHSAAGGLLLCSRGRVCTVHYYVCNQVTVSQTHAYPTVTWQWVALPEFLPLTCREQCGHLTVSSSGGDNGTAAERFRVVIVNHPSNWVEPGGQLDLRVFSSDTGRWEAKQVPSPILSDHAFGLPPNLGRSGISYWMSSGDEAIAFISSGSGSDDANDSIVQLITVPPPLAGAAFNRCIGERPGGGLRYSHSNSSVLEVWDWQQLQAQAGGDHGVASWTLVHRVCVEELMQRNREAAAFLRGQTPRCPLHWHVKPIGFHPTNDDVIFVALPGAAFAYSVEHGTMSLQCAHDCDFTSTADTFPYVHPPYPVQIPAIKDSILAVPVKRVYERPEPRKRERDQIEPCQKDEPNQKIRKGL